MSYIDDEIAAKMDSLQMAPEEIKAKMDYINMQMERLSQENRDMFSKEFKTVSQSLKTLRNVLNRKQAQGLEWYEFNYFLVGSIVLLVLIFG